MNRAKDQKVKKQAFVEANQQLKDRNQERIANEKEEDRNERIDYFPFTHGDLIEN